MGDPRESAYRVWYMVQYISVLWSMLRNRSLPVPGTALGEYHVAYDPGNAFNVQYFRLEMGIPEGKFRCCAGVVPAWIMMPAVGKYQDKIYPGSRGKIILFPLCTESHPVPCSLS
jgi:hypothetical protein